MSFMRKKPKETKTDKAVREAKQDVSDALLTPHRRESAFDLVKKQKAPDQAEVKKLNGQLECLNIIDDIIIAKHKHQPNKEKDLYDAVILDCYQFYTHSNGKEDASTIKKALLGIIQEHAEKSTKPKGSKKSSTMTSFCSDMAVIIKAAIHRDEVVNNAGKGSLKSQRNSVTIQAAQQRASRMFTMDKITKSKLDSDEDYAINSSIEDSGEDDSSSDTSKPDTKKK